MISGLSNISSKISAAVRRQNEMSSTLSSAINRVSTGYKASSIKDDSGAYLAKLSLQTEAATWDYRQQQAEIFEEKSSFSADVMEEGLNFQRDVKSLLDRAKNTAPNSKEREQLYIEWLDLAERQKDLNTLTYANDEQYTTSTYISKGPSTVGYQQTGFKNEWAYDLYDHDSYLNDMVVEDAWWFRDFMYADINVTISTNAPNLNQTALDFMGSSAATIANAAIEANNSSVGVQRTTNRMSASIGSSVQRAQNKAEFADKMININNNAKEALTAADTAKESARLFQAQDGLKHTTNTITNILNAYSNYANQIFNNIKTTQISVQR